MPFNLRRLPHREAADQLREALVLPARRGGRLVDGHPGKEILVLNIRKNSVGQNWPQTEQIPFGEASPPALNVFRAGTMTFQPPNTEVKTQEVTKERPQVVCAAETPAPGNSRHLRLSNLIWSGLTERLMVNAGEREDAPGHARLPVPNAPPSAGDAAGCLITPRFRVLQTSCFCVLSTVLLCGFLSLGSSKQ